MDLQRYESVDAVVLAVVAVWWGLAVSRTKWVVVGGAEGCSWFREPCTSSGSSTQLAKHWAEAPDLCRIQINFNQWTVSHPRPIWYCPQTLLRRSKNIYMSIKTTKGLSWRLYPRYQVTFFPVTVSINPGTKLHILSTLLATFTVHSRRLARRR